MNGAHDPERDERVFEALSRLAADITTPAVSAEADLARGKRQLRRQRLGGAAGAVTTLAAVAGVAVFAAGVPGTGAPAHVSQAASGRASASPSGKATPAPMSVDKRLEGFRDAVSAVLDPQGRHLDAHVSNQQASGVPKKAGEHADNNPEERARAMLGMGRAGGATALSSVGTKLGWNEGGGTGEVMVEVGTSAEAVGGFTPYSCTPGDTGGHRCTSVQLPDGTTGKQQRYGDTLAVYHTRPDGQVVLIAESKLFGNNATTPVAHWPATAKQLLRVATDPRLTLR